LTIAIDFERELPPATDGTIAAINFESARRRSWSRFEENPRRPGLAESIVEQETMGSQFFGDLEALDRIEALAAQLMVDDSAGTELLLAQIASASHRFAEARRHLARAKSCGAPPDAAHRLSLAIDQACGTGLDAVLEARRRIAADTGGLQDLAFLGALLADVERFDESDAVYRQAIAAYRDVSPFPLAWVCFQLGTLWGEYVPDPDSDRAASWYRRAIAYLPGYVKARVHLAEICAEDTEALLRPIVDSGDPEVHWRLGDALDAQHRSEEAAKLMVSARARFEELLDKHLLAFADHGAEFFASSGNDAKRALELARVNVANRQTRRALAQLHALAPFDGACA
jgi:tetratricopeptide (TPR) repeat protein